MAKRVTSKEARSKFSDLMGSVCYGGEEIIVERSGQTVAAVIPVESYERLVAERKARFEIIDRIRSRVPESSSHGDCRGCSPCCAESAKVSC